MNSKNYNNFLSKDEQKTLKLVNEQSNTLKNKNIDNKNILNKSVKEIITEWSYHHQNMLDEIVKLTNKLNKMENIKDSQNWWEYLKEYLYNFMSIVTKEERLIYTGITVLVISLLLYLIDSSN